jgi:hypothetical protein
MPSQRTSPGAKLKPMPTKGSIAIAVAVILLAASLLYGYQIARRQVLPTLSTWIISVVATSLNVASYLVATGWDVLSGTLGLTDALACWCILIVTVMSAGVKMQWQAFEKYYLTASGVIVVFWIFSRSAFITNILMQILITLGCAATMQRLLYANANHESFLFWGLVLVAATLSLYPAAMDGNLLALIYSIRSIVIVCLILSLMYRVHRKTRAMLRPEFQQ